MFFRTMRGDIDRINVDIVNQRKEVTKELGDVYNELKGEVATNKVSMEKAMKVIADKERSWEKKMEKSDKRMDIITNLNKKVLNDIVSESSLYISLLSKGSVQVLYKQFFPNSAPPPK